jgi:subtilisin family serine protease
VMDTGLDTTHPAFRSKTIEVAHLGRGGAGPAWHGTGVTALLAGDPAGGTPGLIPNANFYVADVFHADDDGQPASDTLSMLRGFDWLERRGVKIINMSLSGPPDDLIRDAVAKLSAKNVMFVAAAGNDGIGAAPSYPAAYNEVIAVTAITKDLKNYRYANRGDYIDMAAPGVAIWTALPGALEGYHSGTSFAAPYVTAALAAIYKDLPDKKKSAAMAQLAFKDLGEPGRDPIYGQGLIVAPQSCSGSNQIVEKRAPVTATAGVSWSPSVQSEKSVEHLPWLGLQDSP